MKVLIGPYEENREVKIEYHNYDTWNLDHTLALIILPGLKQLKETNHGYCVSDKADGNSEDDSERWLEIQDKMIWSFEQILDESNDDQFHTNGFDRAGYDAHQVKINEGIMLFGKYFRALWD